MITLSRLREVLNYDAETGLFIWLKTLGSKRMKGLPAGTLNDQGYILICVDRKDYRAHRLAWLHETGCMPARHIDHIDGDRSNNRMSNLRLASISQNLANSRRPITNTSGHKGVSWDASRGKWQVKIQVMGVTKHCGRFHDINDAAAAYERAAKAHFGEFMRLE
jgi:hypothetical protein